MPPLLMITLFSWLAGLAAFIGGSVAWWGNWDQTPGRRELAHGVIAFGGGILIAAVVFALLPHGKQHLGPTGLTLAFCGGGAAFCAVDAWLSRHGGSGTQFMAMLLDFLPEALALGATFGADRRLGLMLAGFIGAQNLPEGFNAFRELCGGGANARTVLGWLGGVSVLGPIAAATGYFALQDRDVVTAVIMTVAGGGILYLVFQDIAPQAKLQRHWLPGLGAVLGFAAGLLGELWIGG